MGLIFVILYFLLSGGYSLWTFFSSNGTPSSLGEIINTEVLVNVLSVIVALGIILNKMWSRHAAIAIAFFMLGKNIFLFATSPSALIVGLYYLAPILTFLTGFGFPQLLLTMFLGLIYSFGMSILILLIMFSKKNMSYFLNLESPNEVSFVEKLKLSKDYFIGAWLVIYILLSNFQNYMPNSFYDKKTRKDFIAVTKAFEESPGYKDMVLKQEQAQEASFHLSLEFGQNDKTLLIQTNASTRSEKSDFYKYDFIKKQLSPIIIPKGFSIKNITPDKKYILGDNRNELFEISTNTIIKLKEDLGVSYSDQEKGFISLGFGPREESYLKYYYKNKAILLYNVLNQTPLVSYPIDILNPNQLTFFWFHSRKQGLLYESQAKSTWRWQSSFETLKNLSNSPPLLNLNILNDNDEDGFVGLKRFQYEKDAKSFVYQFSTNQVTELPIYGEPVALSFKNDYLIYVKDRILNKISLSDPTKKETQLLQTPISEAVVSPTYDYVFYRNDDGSLGYLSIEVSPSQTGGDNEFRFKTNFVGDISFPSKIGQLKVSSRGNLVALSSGRMIQVFWKSELLKETPRFLKLEIKQTKIQP